jgi:hypothetical protein
MLYRSILTAAIVLTASGLLAPQTTQAATTITGGSSASAASAIFVVNGKSGKLAPQFVASGIAPPAYTSSVTKGTVPPVSQTFNILTLAATLDNLKDTATSVGLKSGTLATSSSAAFGLPTGTIKTVTGSTLLTVTATNLASSAAMTKTAAKNTPVGAAKITGLKIVSTAFGINKTFTGSPAANTILYQSKDKTVTIYLNRQITKSSGATVTSLTVSAVDLHIAKLSFAGQTVAGDLYLATSNAN